MPRSHRTARPRRAARPRTAAPAEPLLGRVRDISHRGEGMVETDAGIVLAPGGLIDERVQLTRLSRQAGMWRAERLQVIEPAADRVEPACAWSERCGGCPLMHLELTSQQALKRRWLAQAVADSLLPGTEVGLEAPGPPLGYRRRARLAWQRRNHSEVALGYRRPRRSRIADLPGCEVLEPVLQRSLALVREALLPRLHGRGELLLMASEAPDAQRVHVGLVAEDPQSPAVYAALEALAEQEPISGTWLRVGSEAAAASWGQSQITVADPEGRTLQVPAGGFAQANVLVNQRLGELVIQLAQAEGAHVLELYAGHGNFSVSLAQRAAHLEAIEGDPEAAAACQANLRAHGCATARVRADDVTRVSSGGRVDVAVLDPPRGGAKAALPALLARRPRRIVYVSCDPGTLGRDLRALATQGYQVDRAVALDMFPQTAHVEMVVRAVAVR